MADHQLAADVAGAITAGRVLVSGSVSVGSKGGGYVTLWPSREQPRGSAGASARDFIGAVGASAARAALGGSMRSNPRQPDGVFANVSVGAPLVIKLRGRVPFRGVLVADDGWEATVQGKSATMRIDMSGPGRGWSMRDASGDRYTVLSAEHDQSKRANPLPLGAIAAGAARLAPYVMELRRLACTPHGRSVIEAALRYGCPDDPEEGPAPPPRNNRGSGRYR